VQLDARNSVVSNDGRLYRPVRRLCHELLARMPDVGIEIYRTAHESAAAEMLQAAIAGGSTNALEDVANRYFVTLPGGRALALLGDRLMHEGRYRAAVQVLTDLLAVYPPQNRAQLGITEPWCRFKIAVCLGLAGEQEAAHAAAEAMAAAHRDESLRIAGELQAVADLPGSRLFAPGVSRPATRPDVPVSAPGSWLAAGTDTVVAMWQYRFRTPDPYREPKSSRDSSRMIMMEQGSGAMTMPFAGRYGPASWVAFADGPSDEAPHAWFLEHYRLRRTDAASGLLLAQGDRAEEPPAPQENQSRVRVAANDYALLRPIDDGQRLYAIFGAPRGNSAEAVKVSELVAHQRSDLSRVWSSTQWADGDSGLAGVTFLAAPTVFGERLLLPALRRGDFTLECVDRATGRPLWHTMLHRGGTRFSRPPGCPVIVHGGTALVATNAGCVAAVDAFAGDLRWIRRCERVDPLRRRKGRRPTNDEEMWRGQFVQEELPTFLPNDLHVVRDGVIVGACDSEMLSCLDVATGEVRWMIDATTRHAPWGTPPKLRSLVGVIGDDLFALADNHLVAIDGVGGLVRWVRELPATTTPQHVGRGRGAVVGDHVVVPGGRELIVWSRDGATTRRITLPVFDASREPLGGSFNVSSHGPWLAVGYQGGVEVFSSAPALRQLAATTTDPLRQCAYLVHAGELDAAIARAAAAVRSVAGNGGDAARRQALGKQLLAMVRERAQRELHGADLHAALAMLDAIGDLVTERGLRLDWHLARIELCKEAGDMRAHEAEQMRLYDYMEGKGG
jgi:outer membrane protein assembly factor BamB